MKICISKRYGYVLGFELRPDSYTVLAVNHQGDILFSKCEDNLNIRGENLKELFLEQYRCALDESGWMEMPLLGIGAGMSGMIDSENRIIKGSTPLGVTDPFDFYEKICSNFNVPVFFDNDANCGAWCELMFRRSSSPKIFIHVLLGFWRRRHFAIDLIQPAIGQGIILNGTLYCGSNGTAGEFKSVVSSHRKENYQMEAVSQKKNLSKWVHDTDVNCEVRFSSMGRNGIPYGAAVLVLAKLFINIETLNMLDFERKMIFTFFGMSFGSIRWRSRNKDSSHGRKWCLF